MQCVTSSAYLVHKLLSSKKDEKLFCEQRIVSNYLDSNKKVVELFGNLCKDAKLEDFHYEELCIQMNEYINRKRCRPSKCDQKTDQLARKPCTLVVVAIIVLFMIFIGMLFSALLFFLHHN